MYSATYSFYDDYAVNYPDLASDLADTTPNAGEAQTDIYNFLALPKTMPVIRGWSGEELTTWSPTPTTSSITAPT